MRSFILILLLILAATTAFGFGGGSPYTVFGIGDIRMGSNARNAGMGYAGIGLATGNYIDSYSPATWFRIDRTRIDAALLYEGFNSTDGNRSIHLSRGDFDGIALALPISSSHGIVFVGAVTPYSGVQYNIFSSGAQLGTEYTINFVGHGGLAEAKGGLSYSLTDFLSFGASLNYLFGTIYHEQIFLSEPGSIVVGHQTDQAEIRGVTATLGGMFTGFDRISNALRGLSLGFVLTSRGNLRSNQQFVYQFQGFLEQDTSSVILGRTIVPFSLGIGLSYQASERYVVAADYVTQQWSAANFATSGLAGFRNSTLVGFGGERLPSKDAAARWTDRIAVRLGLYHNSTYYLINDQPINEWGGTAGLGFPLSTGSHLDVAFQYGSRGTTDFGLIQEKFFRVSLSVSLSEQWFQRIEEE